MYVDMPMPPVTAQVWSLEEAGRNLSFPPSGLWGSNSGYQVQLQVPLAAEPSHWPSFPNVLGPYWIIKDQHFKLRDTCGPTANK